MEGQKEKKNEAFSLKPVAIALTKLLRKTVTLVPDCVGQQTEQAILSAGPEEVILLENLRFHPEEESPEIDPDFTKKLASYADVYINDAFWNSP